jgi:DNA adenine methylase
MDAPFTYYGGKARLARRLVALMPRHRTYIEPFFGSGAVLFAKPPVLHEVVNDLDGAIVTFFRVLRERPEDLAAVCRLSPYARQEYEACGVLDAGDELEQARRFWVRVNQSFAKTGNKRTGWSVTTARSQSAPASVRSRIGRFEACAERLARVQIECCDAPELVERLAGADSLVYCDPPYVGTTRTSTGDYRVEADEMAHRRLAEVLRASPATVIVSGYASPLYEELFEGWWSASYDTWTTAGNARGAARRPRSERVWANQALDEGRLAL